uniref:Solute carrier family 40 protein n=1 Tax=Pyrodinium bahamense TaxID=73915 RepID=A0A7S0A053_9DINO|mmetsp:Transcript_17538/g.48423  ORF Transcript_17538/g.48423 Transcript_17538/m.48423 type:complete len:147 (+) Transcript_17538:128-568(+)
MFMFAVPSFRKCLAVFGAVVLGVHILPADESTKSTVREPALAAAGLRFCDEGIQDEGVVLLQESVQIVARNGEQVADFVEVTPAEAEFGCDAGWAYQPCTDDQLDGDELPFMQRFIKPNRLRTLSIAIVGFGLLTLDTASAVLLAF